VRDAIAACPFTVVSDITDRTDTARLADVLIPAMAWGEKNGMVTDSDRVMSRQRAVCRADGKVRLVPVACRPPTAKTEPRYSFR